MKYEFDEVAFRCPYCGSGFNRCPAIPDQTSYRLSIEYTCNTIVEYIKDKDYLVATGPDSHRSMQCHLIEEIVRDDGDRI